MDTLRLGHIITGEQHRDAVHVAVAPVIASERLAPGQHIGFIGEVVGVVKSPIGIVDPFLVGPVFRGDRFWLFLYPGSITSLRHDWAHPAFVNRKDALSDAEARLRVFAETADLTYDRLLEAASDYIDNGRYLIDGGRWEGFNTPDHFWDDYEAVTGKKVDDDDRGSFFSCSC